jgi:hypothetical protein
LRSACIRTALLFVITAICTPCIALPDTSAELDDVLSGFEEPESDKGIDDALAGFDEPEPQAAEQDTQSLLQGDFWRLRGDFWLSTAWNYAHGRPDQDQTDWRGLSRFRINVRPELRLSLGRDWDANIRINAFHDFAYQFNGRDDYTSQLLRHYESELEFQDTYVRGPLGANVEAKLGRQIVVWGKSDNLRVVDVLNPLDRREPGVTDIENLRLPVMMSRVDLFSGGWNLTGLALHEIRFDKLPVSGSDFYPYEQALPEEELPGDGGSNTEYAMALSGVMPGWDVSLHWARLFNDEAHLEMAGDKTWRVHARVTLWGAAGNVALGDWLLKSEAAHWRGLEYALAAGDTFDRTDVLLGVDYNGFDNTTITLESVLRHIHQYDERLGQGPVPRQRNTVETAFRYSADFLHDLWNVVIVATRFGEAMDEGGITRAQFSYELRQSLELTVGVVAYHSGAQWPFDAYSDNDRLFAELKYSF